MASTVQIKTRVFPLGWRGAGYVRCHVCETVSIWWVVDRRFGAWWVGGGLGKCEGQRGRGRAWLGLS